MAINYHYPTYVHKPSISSTVYQSGEQITWDNKWTTVRRTYIGPDNAILSDGYNHRKGTDYNCGNGLSGVVESCTTEKIDSDRSKLILTIRCSSGTDGGSSQEAGLLTETWSCKMAQLEIPLYSYCSPDPQANPYQWGNATLIQQWENEQDASIKSQYHYLEEPTNPTSEQPLAGKSLSIAMMINSGIDSRICFYPEATKTSIYSKVPSNVSTKEEALNTIDTPTILSSDLASWLTVSNYSWLKSSYDMTQNSDATWTLVETWIGTPNFLGGWRPELYDKTSKWDVWPGNQS